MFDTSSYPIQELPMKIKSRKNNEHKILVIEYNQKPYANLLSPSICSHQFMCHKDIISSTTTTDKSNNLSDAVMHNKRATRNRSKIFNIARILYLRNKRNMSRIESRMHIIGLVRTYVRIAKVLPKIMHCLYCSGVLELEA